MSQRLARIAMFLLSPLTWLFLVVNSAIIASTIIVLSWFGVRGRAFDRFGTFWGRSTLWTAAARVHVEGLQHLTPGQPYVIMANHQSFHDVWALFGYFPAHFRWVIKQELSRIPVFGPACSRMGHIFVDRGNSEKARASLALAGERIRGGTSVAFFPEGTRSRDGRLGPFKKGGFFIALAAGVPILPITIDGGGRLFPSGGLVFRPGHMRIRIHPAIDVGAYSQDSKDALMERVRQAIASGLEGPAAE
jgi:1-acyl-sn-glycerol-3-phosphate acyltransferase